MIKRNEGWKNMFLGLLILCFMLTIISPIYASDCNVKEIKVMDRTGTIKVYVDTDGPVGYAAYRAKEPGHCLIVELYPAVLSPKCKAKVDINYGLVENVRVYQAADKSRTVKVKVNVISPIDYKVITAAGKRGIVLELGTAMISTAKAAKAVAHTPVSTQPVHVSRPEPVVAKTPKAVETPKHVARATHETMQYKPAAPRYAPVAAKKKAPAVPPEKMVSMDFVNADLIYVLKILAKEMNLNIVTDPTVSGAVTMTLKNVPASGALNIIVRMSGYSYKVVGNTMIVGDEKTLAKIPNNIMKVKKVGGEVTQVIPLENAKPGDVTPILSSNYPDARIQPDTRLNALIVTSDPDTIKQMKTLASQLDVQVPAPPPPKTEVIPLKAATSRDVLATLQKLVPTLSYNTDERLNALIVTGDDASITQVKDYLDELDAPLKQVNLDVKVVDLTETGAKTFGGTLGNQGSNGQLINTTFQEVNPAGTTGSGTDGIIPITYFTRSALQLSYQLNALINSSEAKVLAAPKVTTISGKEAQIHIGEKYPVVYYDPRAGQYQVIYVDIGTKLNITAVVLPDGNVSLNVRPDISTLLDLINNQYPHTANRTANVYMRVKDGETMVLGGLLRETENVTKAKIPLLGDIPLLGQMFKTESRTKSKNEVVIMITPRILSQ